MKQKLEQVIKDITGRKNDAILLMSGGKKGSSALAYQEGYGRYVELKHVLAELREVVADETSDTRIVTGDERDISGE